MQRVVLLTALFCAAAVALDSRNDGAGVLQSEPLTSASSLAEAGASARAGVGAGAGASASASVSAGSKARAHGRGGAGAGAGAGGFDVHSIDWTNKKSRGSCCRICPNIFYAVPRVVPRPNPNAKPRFTQKQAREARFAAIFDRPEPPTYESDDVSFIGFAEQLSTRPAASEASAAAASGLRPDRFTVREYPPWPLHEYTNDPYQDEPIPEFTKSAALPGVQCCNVCPSPGVGQLKYPDFLRWGENPATDNYPEPPWDIPCCKLCSKGCYPNGTRRPPQKPPSTRSEYDDESSFAETNATALLAATMRGGRKRRAYKARGNWPKTLDPPGANRPSVPPPDTACASMTGCCQVCYNHPFIFDHAPSGVW